MGKNLNISYLMDFYGQLLTKKQLDALELYYNEDLSLAEIAAELDISRQGVRDFIKRGEKQLAEFEDKLGLAEQFSDISAKLCDIKDNLKKIRENSLSEEVCEALCKIESEIEIIQEKF